MAVTLNNCMRNQLDIYKTIDNVFVSENTLNVILEFERVLDQMDMYAYENWIKGELVEGPLVTRYWVEASFMWPLKLMPDPDAALRLADRDCKVYYSRDYYVEPHKATPVQKDMFVDPTTGTPRPKLKRTPVWVVTIKMPRRFIDGEAAGDRMNASGEVDLDSVNQAYDQNLDNAQESGAEDESQTQ
jgi:hypothetical protein